MKSVSQGKGILTLPLPIICFVNLPTDACVWFGKRLQILATTPISGEQKINVSLEESEREYDRSLTH